MRPFTIIHDGVLYKVSYVSECDKSTTLKVQDVLNGTEKEVNLIHYATPEEVECIKNTDQFLYNLTIGYIQVIFEGLGITLKKRGEQQWQLYF